MEKTDMIYGTRAVIEAILAGKNIDKVMIQSGLSNDLIKELIAVGRNNNVPITFVPAEKLKRLSTKNHQGVICLLSSISFASVDNLIFKAYNEGREPFFLILDRITDVRNFGAIVRTAECAWRRRNYHLRKRQCSNNKRCDENISWCIESCSHLSRKGYEKNPSASPR
jgi:23S rRNA (guanosine2251-2'-O)-methyltransferase